MFELYNVCIMTVDLLAIFEKQVLKPLEIVVNITFYLGKTFKIYKKKKTHHRAKLINLVVDTI